MRGMNKVILIGNVGGAPELRTTPNGRTVATLSLATNRPVKQGETWTQTADWHRVTLWERDAELVGRFVDKGSPIAIEAELRYDKWTDPQGQKRSKTLLVARKVHLLGKTTGAPPPNREAQTEHPVFKVGSDDGTTSIPF